MQNSIQNKIYISTIENNVLENLIHLHTQIMNVKVEIIMKNQIKYNRYDLFK